MDKTVRILGSAPNLTDMPPLPDGHEMWMANNPKIIRKFVKDPIFVQWTRWFNLHSREWQETNYPLGFNWYRSQDGSRPYYTQQVWDDIPGCVAFPRQKIQETFPEAGRYYVCSINWMMAHAMMEGFRRIEFHGIILRDKHRPPYHADYTFERKCFFYWVNKARDLGIEVIYPRIVEEYGTTEAGDPNTYDGPLYGYETKPEHGVVTCICPVERWFAVSRFNPSDHLKDCPTYIKSLEGQLPRSTTVPAGPGSGGVPVVKQS